MQTATMNKNDNEHGAQDKAWDLLRKKAEAQDPTPKALPNKGQEVSWYTKTILSDSDPHKPNSSGETQFQFACEKALTDVLWQMIELHGGIDELGLQPSAYLERCTNSYLRSVERRGIAGDLKLAGLIDIAHCDADYRERVLKKSPAAPEPLPPTPA